MDRIDFCAIAPTSYLHLVEKRPVHLVLAHLIEDDFIGKTDGTYTEFYKQEKANGSEIIMDNSAFEMYKQGREMFDQDSLIEMASLVDADYIALSDYPGQHQSITIEAAKKLIPAVKKAGYKTFYVPQSEIGDLDGYLEGLLWGLNNPDIDLIGLSILGCPNAYGVERDNNLQRYLSRLSIFREIESHLNNNREKYKNKFHLLGLVDGPKELDLLREYSYFIKSNDSSSPVQHGILGISYDNSPTGLIDGKNETEVDFNAPFNSESVNIIKKNLSFIDDNISCKKDVKGLK